jgi:hypothetical protein
MLIEGLRIAIPVFDPDRDGAGQESPTTRRYKLPHIPNEFLLTRSIQLSAPSGCAIIGVDRHFIPGRKAQHIVVV